MLGQQVAVGSLGWMAYVPHVVTKEQLPLAADIVPAKGGLIIVAVDEPFDLANKALTKPAQTRRLAASPPGSPVGAHLSEPLTHVQRQSS